MTRMKTWNLLAIMAIVGIFSAAPVTSAFAQVCDGLAQEAVYTNMRTTAASTTLDNQVVPGSTLSGGGSGGAADTDTYTVTLSGEGDHTLAAGGFTVQAQMSINSGAYFNIDPIEVSNVFHRGTAEMIHTMTWCRRAAAAVSTGFRIIWSEFGGGTATLDGYTMRVERSN